MTLPIEEPRATPLPEDRFTGPTALCPHPERWSSTDSQSTEREVAELAFGLVRGLQPTACLETGTGFAETAQHIGNALARNGHGVLYTLEYFPERVAYSRRRLTNLIDGDYVALVETDSLVWEPPTGVVFDFCWFDSFIENRVPEFWRYRPAMRAGTICCFHDTAPGHGGEVGLPGSDARSTIAHELRREIRMIHLPTPRGVTLGEVLP